MYRDMGVVITEGHIVRLENYNETTEIQPSSSPHRSFDESVLNRPIQIDNPPI